MANDNSPRQKVIIDTDFGFMNDDCTTSLFALRSARLDVLGLTIVAGNYSQQQGLADALRICELTGYPDLPVCQGAEFPLVHERGTYEDQVWGKYGTSDPLTYEMGPPETKKPHPLHAANFIVEQVRRYPGQVILAAIGPLTNLALALRLAPDITHKVKRAVIMGGAIGVLPDGHGNITPSAEFNFWVDAEAARIVLRSSMPITLMPLNIARRTRFSHQEYRRITAASNPVSELFKSFLGPYFENAELDKKSPRLFYALCDQVVIASIIQPDLIKTIDMCVDVDISHTLAYGTSYGYVRGAYAPGSEQWPIEDGSPIIQVISDLDVERFLDVYIDALTNSK